MITKSDIEAYRAATPEKQRGIAERLLVANTPLIVKMVKKCSRYAPPGTDWDDLMQAGRIAFIRALSSADPNRTFSTYYVYWLKGELRKVGEQVSEIFRPRRSVMDYKAVQKEQKIRAIHGRDATAEELGVTEERLKTWREQPMRAELSDALELPEPSETAEETLSDRQDRLEALYYISHLPARDQDMLRRLRAGKSVADVAKSLGVSQKEIRARLQDIADA